MRARAKPRVDLDPTEDTTFLDWSKHRLGPPAPCRLCRGKALLRDEHGRPCHKVCAEREGR